MSNMVDFGDIEYGDEDEPSGFSFLARGEDDPWEMTQGEVAYLLGLGIRKLLEDVVAMYETND